MAAAPPELQTSDPERAAEARLVERVLSGEQAAFEELYERYLPPVHRFVASRLRQREDTEETVQQVFLNVFRSLHSFRGEGPLGAWVFGLTRRTLANRFKKRRPATVPLEGERTELRMLRPVGSREPNPQEMIELQERVQRLEHAFASDLSGIQRRVFRLHHLEHRSIREIARLLCKTEDAVKSHLYRTRKLLLAR